jgi:hypothetical protein
LKESLLGKIYADKAKVGGVDLLSSSNALIGDPQTIYIQYLEAFKKGVYNFIKEDEDRFTKQMIPRKYFAGGATQNYATLTNVIRVSSKELNQAMSSKILNLDQATVSLDQRINKDAAMKNEAIIFKNFDEFSKKVVSRHMVSALKDESYRNPEIRKYMAIARQAFDLDRIGFNVILNLVNDAEYYADNKFLTNLGKMKANASAALEILFPIERDKREYQRIFYFFKTITDVLSLEIRSLSDQNVAAMNKEKIGFKRYSEFKRPDLFGKLKEALEWGSFIDPLKQGLDLEIMFYFLKFEEVFNRDSEGFNGLMNVMRPFLSWEEFYQSKELKEFQDRNPKVVDALFPLGATEPQKERFQYNFLFAQTVLDTIDDANAAMSSSVRLRLVSSHESDNFIFESFEAFEHTIDASRTINMLKVDRHDGESIARYKKYFKDAYDVDSDGFHLYMHLVNDSENPQDTHYLNGRDNLVRDHRNFLEILFSGVSTDEGIDNIFWFAKEVITWRNAAMNAVTRDMNRRSFLTAMSVAIIPRVSMASFNRKPDSLSDNMKFLTRKLEAQAKRQYLFIDDNDFKQAISDWIELEFQVEDVSWRFENQSESGLNIINEEQKSRDEQDIDNLYLLLYKVKNDIFEQEYKRLYLSLVHVARQNNVAQVQSIKEQVKMIMSDYGNIFTEKLERMDQLDREVDRVLALMKEDRRGGKKSNSLSRKSKDLAMATLDIDISRDIFLEDNVYYPSKGIDKQVDNFKILVGNYLFSVPKNGKDEARLRLVLALDYFWQEFEKEELEYFWPEVFQLSMNAEDRALDLILLLTRLKRQLSNDNFKAYWDGGLGDLIEAYNKDVSNLDVGYRGNGQVILTPLKG